MELVQKRGGGSRFIRTRCPVRWIERNYGSFQRVLSLPEDADQEGIRATFKKGVLTITMPRKETPKAEVKQIEIKSNE